MLTERRIRVAPLAEHHEQGRVGGPATTALMAWTAWLRSSGSTMPVLAMREKADGTDASSLARADRAARSSCVMVARAGLPGRLPMVRGWQLRRFQGSWGDGGHWILQVEPAGRIDAVSCRHAGASRLLVGSNQERVAHEGRAKPGHIQLGDVHTDAKCIDCDGAVCHSRLIVMRGLSFLA